MSDWSTHRLGQGLAGHAAAWDVLNSVQMRGNPMLDSRFVDALLVHFGDGSERLCINHLDGAVQAMCLLRPRGSGVWTTFLPNQAQIGPAIVKNSDLAKTLFKALPGFVGQIDFLCDDPQYGDWSDISPPLIDIMDHALTMAIGLDGSFAQYWASRSKKLIQNMGRYERRLAADGIASRMVCITQADDMAAAVTRYAKLESGGWKGKAGTALATEDAQGRFYQDVVKRFAKTDSAAVYELWFGDQLAASRLTIRVGLTLVMLKTTYDESLAKYSPGRLLLRQVVQSAFEHAPGGAIEFYTDANADQLSWATSQRWMRHVSVHRHSITSNVLTMVRAGRQFMNGRSPGVATTKEGEDQDKVEVFAHPREFPPDVVELFTAAEATGVESGVTWYRNLVDNVYPQHAGVHFYVLRRGGQPIAALPVLIEQDGIGKQAKSLTNFYSALYAPAIASGVKAEQLVPLIHEICTRHAPLGSFRFAPMDPQALAYRSLFSALRTAGLAPFKFFCFGNWFLATGNTWPVYLAGRDGKVRSTLKRMGKKFAAEGGTLEMIKGGEALERGLQAFKEVYASSWKVPEPYPNFVPGLIRCCAERNWLRLGVAWLNDKPVAAQLWIVAGGKAEIYKLAYHEGYKAYAPGTLLTALLMQTVMEQDRVTEVDYLIGDEAYKETWMNNRRERWGLVAYNLRSVPGIVGLGRELAGRAIKYLKSKA